MPVGLELVGRKFFKLTVKRQVSQPVFLMAFSGLCHIEGETPSLSSLLVDRKEIELFIWLN